MLIVEIFQDWTSEITISLAEVEVGNSLQYEITISLAEVEVGNSLQYVTSQEDTQNGQYMF